MVDIMVLGISLQNSKDLPLLLLHPTGTRRILSVKIGPMEAVAVSTALHGALPLRDNNAPPMTHEFLLNTIGALGATLAAVELVGFEEGDFLARAVFLCDGVSVRVACRPADGVALALRGGASVRCADALLEHAESIDVVMAELPEYMRTLVVAKLGEQGSRADVPGWMRPPAVVEDSLAARARNGAMSAHENLVGVARKMLEDDARRRGGASSRSQGQVAEPKKITLTTARTGGDPAHIRVTMVRRTDRVEDEIVNEFNVMAGDIPNEVLAGLGLNHQEVEVINGASGDERWTRLLRMLAPTTKVPM